MFEKTIEAIIPFGLTLIVFAGTTLAGWTTFTNPKLVGILAVGFGVLFIVAHVAKQITSSSKDDK